MLAATYKIDIIYDPRPRMQWYMYIHTGTRTRTHTRTTCTALVLLLGSAKSVFNFWEIWPADDWDIV